MIPVAQANVSQPLGVRRPNPLPIPILSPHNQSTNTLHSGLRHVLTICSGIVMAARFLTGSRPACEFPTHYYLLASLGGMEPNFCTRTSHCAHACHHDDVVLSTMFPLCSLSFRIPIHCQFFLLYFVTRKV